MRVVLLSMLVMLSAPKAEACPHRTMCISAGARLGADDATRGEVRRPRPTMLQLAIRQVDLSSRSPRDHLTTSLRTHVVQRAQTLEMPWIWQVLRSSVYARMPRYERPAQRFSFVVSPVVVSSPQDTVPGVGLEGGF